MFPICQLHSFLSSNLLICCALFILDYISSLPTILDRTPRLCVQKNVVSVSNTSLTVISSKPLNNNTQLGITSISELIHFPSLDYFIPKITTNIFFYFQACVSVLFAILSVNAVQGSYEGGYGGHAGDFGGHGGDYGGHGGGHDISHTVEITKHVPIPVYKHEAVPIPHTVPVPIPKPVAVPVPQPYPVHIKVPQPVAVPVIKTITIPVEKPVPYKVEKEVIYHVEKPVPVPVEKHIPVRIPKPVPVKVPVYKVVYHHSKH